MSEPRDRLDAWLKADVEPLLPPPGAFGRISRRARRRRRNQLLMSCAAGVAVIAVAAAVPQVISALRPGHAPSGPPPAASQSRTVTTAPTPSGSPSATSPPPAVSPSPATESNWTVQTGLAVPASFQPTSITLVGPDVGAVIGQARCAAGTGQCTSLAATNTEGSSWYGLSAAPAAGAPDGSAGVSQLRFLNPRVGWAFGPALYATVDGGGSWTAEPVPGGQRVMDLETAGNHAFALLATCTGGGSDYSAGCTRFSLYTSAAGSTSWQPVTVPAGYSSMTAAASSGQAAASLVLASGTPANPDAGAGYLLTPSGALLSGDLTGGPWRVVSRIPRACRTGGILPNGQPEGAQLASGSLATTPQLVLSCDGPTVVLPPVIQYKVIYTSPDGKHWTRTRTPPRDGTAYSLAASDGGLIVLATTAGIDYSTNSGASWNVAAMTSSPPGGFSYVGMTTSSDGVAVPADAGLGEVFITTDGGQIWTPSVVHGG